MWHILISTSKGLSGNEEEICSERNRGLVLSLLTNYKSLMTE